MTGGNVFGFTGTSEGMTPTQFTSFLMLLHDLEVRELHLGDCVGADALAWEAARAGNLRTVGHPPTDPKKRAFLEYDEEYPPRPYMERNEGIARCGIDGLIACPPESEENPGRGRGAGTWSTVRRARKLKRRIWIIDPDGDVRRDIG